MPAFQLGDAVRIKFTTMEGVITGADLNPTTLAIRYRVSYFDPQANADQERVFEVDQIEAVT